LESPFSIVYGTLGSVLEQRALLNDAISLANQWFLYGNGNVSVISDQEANIYTDRNLILLGGPASNFFTAKISNQLPVRFSGNYWTIDKKEFKEPDLGIQFLAPLGNRLVVVIAGNTPTGYKHAFERFPIFTAMLVPDFIVTQANDDFMGNGAAVSAGYWGNYWEYDPRSSY